tara:strand:- start:5902 stop:7410 length:1509 start_codon:yes stop_codon:yes gene_type:complete
LNIKKFNVLIFALFLSPLIYSGSLYSYENTSKLSQFKKVNTLINSDENDIKNNDLVIRFEDLKEILLQNNEQLKKYRSQISQSKAVLKSKIAAWSPRLNLASDDLPSFTSGKSKNKISEDSATKQTKIGLSGSLEWDIINPSRRLEINIAKKDLENTEYNYKYYEKDLYLEAVKKYFLIQASMQDIKISENAIEISLVSLNEARNRYNSGIGNKLELLESKTQLGRERLLLEKRIGQLTSNQNDLAKILNIKRKFLINKDENPKILGFWKLKRDKSFSLAVKNRNDLKIKEKNILINQKKAKSILSGKKPTISIFNTYSLSTSYGEAGVESPNYDNLQNANSNKVGIKFNLNLFDGGLIKENFNSLKSKENELIAELNEKKLEIDNQLNNALINLNIAKSSIMISYEQVQSANESLNISLKRLDAGLTTQREIVNLQGDVSEAESNYINSIKNYNENLFSLVRIVGIDNHNFCDLSNHKDRYQNTFMEFAIKKDLIICNSLT